MVTVKKIKLAPDNSSGSCGNSSNVCDNKNRGIDFIFSEIVGGNGLWQWGTFLLMYSLAFTGGIPLLIHMFAAFTPEFRCRVPVCDNAVGLHLSSEDLINPTWLQFAVPAKTENAAEFLIDGSKYDPCRMYETVDPKGGCVAENFKSSGNRSQGIICEEYVWDLSEFPETLTTKLGLVCEHQSQRRLLGSIMMVGLVIGSAVGGRVGDVIGRKLSMFVAVLIIGPTVVAGGYSENYMTYAVLRLITCSCLPLIWVNQQSCIFECFGSKHRIGVMVAKDFTWPITTLILACFGYFFRHWASLHLAIGISCIVVLVAWFITPESLRWLAQNGKRDEAHILLARIAKWNRKKISPEHWEEIDQILDEIQESAGHKIEQNLSPLTMFTRGYLLTSVILVLAWVTTNMGSFTLTLNATKLSGNIFLNFILSSLVDIPMAVVLLFTLDSLGRRLNLSLCVGMLGTSCLVLAFVPKNYTTAVLVFYLIGKV